MDAVGNFIVTWNSSNGATQDVFARWFTAAGVPEPEFRVNTTIFGKQDNPVLTMNRAGEFVVAWRDTSEGDSNIRAQRYDRRRRPIGGEFHVNATPAGSRYVRMLLSMKKATLLWSGQKSVRRLSVDSQPGGLTSGAIGLIKSFALPT